MQEGDLMGDTPECTTITSVEKQKVSVRESILRVFRARKAKTCKTQQAETTKSPKASEVKKTDIIEVKRSLTEVSKVRKSLVDRPHGGAAQEKVRSPLHDCLNTHRVKRKRTRKQRDKLHTNFPAARSVAKEVEREKADLRRHMKHKMRSRIMPPRVSAEVIASAITTNRLTRRLGIFNQVKKSEKISREPLIVPDEVEVKTNKDIEQVLDLTDAGLHHTDSSLLEKWYPSNAKKDSRQRKVRRVSESQGSESYPGSAKSYASIPRIGEDEHTTSMVTPRSIQASPQTLPQSPELAAIASKLLQSIKPRIVFPHRRYLQETVDELGKLLRQKIQQQQGIGLAPSSIGSCTSQTVSRPCVDNKVNTPNTNPLTRDGDSLSQGAAVPEADILLPSASPTTGTTVPDHCDIRGDGELPAGSAISREPNEPMQHASSTVNHLKEQPNTTELSSITLDALTDAKHLLDCNDKAMKKRKGMEECTANPSFLEASSKVMNPISHEACTYVCPHHSASTRYPYETFNRSPRHQHVAKFVRAKPTLQPQGLHYPRFGPRQHMTGVSCVHGHVMPTMGVTSSAAGLHSQSLKYPLYFSKANLFSRPPHGLGPCLSCASATSGVVTEYNYPTADIPPLPGLLHHVGDLSSMAHIPREEAMDILDLLDGAEPHHLPEREASTPAAMGTSSPASFHYCRRALDARPHPRLARSSLSHPTQSPPTWYPFAFPHPQKPLTDNPSPSEDLYPRRLY